ncbi:MAG: hypothetical protein ACLR8Y_08170 [Alistipes indistinctus]
MAIGLTESRTGDDHRLTTPTTMLQSLDDLNFGGSIFAINPSFQLAASGTTSSFGARFGYSKTDGHIDNAALDLGEANDMNISFSDISTSTAPLRRSASSCAPTPASTRKGTSGLFAELEASCKARKIGFLTTDRTKRSNITHGNNRQFKFSFNPGCAVFVFPERMHHLSLPGSAACSTRK